ncbi:amylosucrase [Klenkia soli]|uniref:Amylosucrase n=1 Tax=Klenkia soli TaxID=1052260 RepID=A0A1H0UI37_9ACTN|nr:amylosucrase [Klenkia soli]SDP65648.1 amylosucrase [Klenkia soli]
MSPVDEVLAGIPAHRRELFAARVERWLPDLLAGLTPLYADPTAVADRLLLAAARAYAARDDELHDLDLRRSLAPDWFQRPDVIGYAAYAERFAGSDLAAVTERTAYLQHLGVKYLHLMPLLTPGPPPNDGGYAVADYGSIRPDLGTMADLAALTRDLRGRGMSLCLDLVLNHVAREHTWAREARAGDPVKRAYFRVYPDRTEPDAWEATLPEVFPDLAPGNFTWDDDLAGWVWTTFNSYQWDVDWANPDVFCEYADVVLDLANHGVEILRLDAIAFTWKRPGTNCQNQPEVHALTQALRTVARIACPALLFKAEAIVGPKDLVAYLGTGEHWGKVSDLAYHNGLMVQVWSMLASRDAVLASHALQQLAVPPSTTAWITYVRCHDDIGWAIDDGEAAAVGISGFEHRRFLSDWYSGDFWQSWARGLVFGENEATGDRRISGTAASLAGLGAWDPQAVARVLLAHAVVFGFGGIPVLWSGDELGALNDPHWADEPGHAGDNRWAHRPRLTWGATTAPGPPLPVPDSPAIVEGIAALTRARTTLPQLHASVAARVLDPRDPAVLLVAREHPLGTVLGAYNVAPEPRHVPLDVLRQLGLDPAAVVDHLTGAPPRVAEDAVQLAPYQACWLR